MVALQGELFPALPEAHQHGGFCGGGVKPALVQFHWIERQQRDALREVRQGNVIFGELRRELDRERDVLLVAQRSHSEALDIEVIRFLCFHVFGLR